MADDATPAPAPAPTPAPAPAAPPKTYWMVGKDDGQMRGFTRDQLPDASRFYRPPTQGEWDAHLRREGQAGVGGFVRAAAAEATPGLTFGLINPTSPDIEAAKQAHPVGKLLGDVVPFVVGPEAEAMNAAAHAVKPVGEVLEHIATAAEPGLASWVARTGAKATGMAVEEAARSIPFSLQQTMSDDVFGDKQEAASAIWKRFGTNALVFGGAGAAGQVLMGSVEPAVAALKAPLKALGEKFERYYPKLGAKVGLGTEDELEAKIAAAKAAGPDVEATAPLNETTISPAPGPRPDADAVVRDLAGDLSTVRQATKGVRKFLTEELRPADRAQLLADPTNRFLPPAEAHSMLHTIAAGDVLDELQSDPLKYNPRITGLFEKMVGGLNDDVASSKSVLDHYTALDDFRGNLGRLVDDNLTKDPPGDVAAALRQVDQLRRDVAHGPGSLEDPEIWGTQGAQQAKINGALTRLSASEANIIKMTTEDLQGATNRTEEMPSPRKLMSMLAGGTGPKNDLRQQVFRDYLQSLSGLHQTASEVAQRAGILGGAEDREALLKMIDQVNAGQERFFDLKDQTEAWQSRDAANAETAAQHATRQEQILQEAYAQQADQSAIKTSSGAKAALGMLKGDGAGILSILLGHVGAGLGYLTAKTVGRVAFDALSDADVTIARYARMFRVAKAAEAMTDRAVGRVLSAGEKAAPLAGRLMAAHGRTEAEEVELYEKRRDQIQQLAQPSVMQEHFDELTQDLPGGMSAAVAAHGANVIGTLASQIREPPQVGMFPRPYKPDVKTAADFNQLYDLAQDPVRETLAAIHNGTLTYRQVQFGKAVDPGGMRQAQRSMLNGLTKMGQKKVQALPYARKVKMSMFLEQPIDRSTSQSYAGAFQQLYAATPTPQPNAAGRPSAAGKALSEQARNLSPQLQEMGREKA